MSSDKSRSTPGGLRSALALALVFAFGSVPWPTVSTASGAHLTASGPPTAPSDAVRSPTNWPSANGDLYNQRVAQSTIPSANVSTMGVAWTVRLRAAGLTGYDVANSVIDHGIVYLQDGASNVMAVRFTTGQMLWQHRFNSPDYGPNGVTVANGRICGVTAKGVFALDARTGRQVWYNTHLAAGRVSFDMPPQAASGKVFVASALTVGGGILYALNADTGAIAWRFQTVVDTIGQHLQSTAGDAWDAVLIGPDHSVYVGTGNP